LSEDARFTTADLRERNRDELNTAIEKATMTRTSAEWIEVLNHAGVPAGPVYALDEMFHDPQVELTGIVQSLDHPKLGRVEILGQPIDLHRTPPRVRTPPPELGEHTDDVLAELGYSKADVAAMRERGVL